MSQEKVSVYSLSDLKNKSDDAIPNYLDSLGFKRSHTLTDIRLGLGYASLAVATACFVWDLKLGFDNTKYYSLAAVAIYVVLNLAMTYVASLQGSNIYTATAPNGETIRINTTTPRYDPVYHVEVTVVSKAGQTTTTEIKRPFAEWFDSAGTFVARPFQTILASSIPIIGTADPKRVVSAAASSDSLPEYSAAMLDILAAASTPDASGAESEAAKASGTSSGKKGAKRRKAQ